MKFGLKHEKTTIFPVDGQLVQVSNLPEEVRNEVDTLDRMIQKKIDQMVDLEITELAIVLKSQQLQAYIQQMLKDAKEQQVKQDTATKAQEEVQREMEKEDAPKAPKSSKRK